MSLFHWLATPSLALILSLAGLGACTPHDDGFNDTEAATPVPGHSLNVLERWPHDPQAFTEGLAVDGPVLYESTGGYGDSRLQAIDWRSGDILASHELPDDRFGEGLTRLHHRLYQLTWKAGQGIIYDVDTLAVLDHFNYRGQGWGLTTDGRQLIMSNGSAVLQFFDPKGFERRRRLRVTDNGQPLDQLNELEYIDGRIWANIWHADRIVVIDPATGHVVADINGHGLRQALAADGCGSSCATAGVLNGIAYDPARHRLLLTGKNWPALFEVEVPALLDDDARRATPPAD